jgi:hypothetical protein
MGQIIILRRSAQAGKKPSISDIKLGEIAANTYDGKLFIKKSGSVESVQEVIVTDAVNDGSITITGTGSFGQVNSSNIYFTGLLSGSSIAGIGNATQFSQSIDYRLVVVEAVSASSAAALTNVSASFSASQNIQDIRLNSLETNSLSASAFNSFSSSVDGRLVVVETVSASSAAALTNVSGAFVTTINSLSSSVSESLGQLSGSITTTIGTIQSTYATTSSLNTVSGAIVTTITNLSQSVSHSFSESYTTITQLSQSVATTISNLDSIYATDSELSSVSGSFATTISNLDSIYATDSELSSVSGAFAGTIDTIYTDISQSTSESKNDITQLSQSVATTISNLDSIYATDSDLSSVSGAFAVQISASNDNITQLSQSVATTISNLDDIYATDSELSSVSSSLSHSIGVVATNLSSVSGAFATTISNLDDIYATDSDLSSVSGAFATTIFNLDSIYATDSELSSVSSSLSHSITVLADSITNVSGAFAATISNLDSIYATDSDLSSVSGAFAATISNLDDIYATDSELSSVSGAFATTISNLDSIYATDSELSSVSGAMVTTISNLSQSVSSSIDVLSGSFATTIGELGNTYATTIQLSNVSQSVSESILQNTNSILTNSASFSASQNIQDIRLNSLETNSLSASVFNSFSSSVDSRIDAIEGKGISVLLGSDLSGSGVSDEYGNLALNATLITSSANFISGARASITTENTAGSTGVNFTYTNGVISAVIVGEGLISGAAQLPSGLISGAAQLPIGTVSGSSQINHDDTTGYVANRHIDHTGVSMNAGAGLTGGGSIFTTRTFNVGAGRGITVNTDDVEINTGSAHFISGSRNAIVDSPFSSSVDSRINTKLDVSVFTAYSGAVDSRMVTLATTGSNILYGTQTITGSLYISSNLIVQGSSSLQNITASAVSIGTNIIKLNTDYPAIRFAGIQSVDSGSLGETGSLYFDSLYNRWIIQGPQSDPISSIILMGPRHSGSLGNESGLSVGKLPVAVGAHNLENSLISQNSNTVTIDGELKVKSDISSSTLNGIGNVTLYSASVSNRLVSYENFSSSIGVTIKTQLNNNTVVSASSQVVYTQLNSIPAGIVSGSSQVVYTQLNSIPAGIVSGAAQVRTLLPTGTVSGSSQVVYTSLSSIPAGIVSGSSQLTASYDGRYVLSGSISSLPDGVVSGSSQLTASYDGRYEIQGTGIVSGAVQIVTLLPIGTVSGSSQLTSSYDARYVISGSIGILPDGVVSGSSQVVLTETNGYTTFSSSLDNRMNTFATTGSNIFIGDEVISGSLYVSGTISIGDSLQIEQSTLEGGIVINNSRGTGSAFDFEVKTENHVAIRTDSTNDSVQIMDNAMGKVGFFGNTPSIQSTGWGANGSPSVKTYTITATTLNELSEIVGTLINELKSKGIIG